jgi:hypothetical protein
MHPAVFAVLFLFGLVVVGAFMVSICVPRYTSPPNSVLGNSQGAAFTSLQPESFYSRAHTVNVPLSFLQQPSEFQKSSCLYYVEIQTHVVSAETQIVCLTNFWMLRQQTGKVGAAELLTHHVTFRDQYPPNEDIHMTIEVANGNLFANISNPRKQALQVTLFEKYSVSCVRSKGLLS